MANLGCHSTRRLTKSTSPGDLVYSSSSTPTGDPVMKSPSPPPNSSATKDNGDDTKKETTVDDTNDIPLTSPLRNHPKRLLPSTLSSTYPHGHISGLPRNPEQQAAFDSRRAEILRTMTAVEIEQAYEDVAAKVRREMDEAERTEREVGAEIDKLKQEREMEIRVWGKLRGIRGGSANPA